MSVKLLLLKSGEQVISDVKELIRKDSDKVYGYVLHRPHKVVASKAVVLTEDASDNRNVEITLSPWILLTEDKSMTVPQDWIITIVNPIKSIVEMYEEKTNG
jgi:hypothetical protein